MTNHLGNVLATVSDRLVPYMWHYNRLNVATLETDRKYSTANPSTIATPANAPPWYVIGLPKPWFNEYEADVLTANDYYPGGMLMPGRTYSTGTPYRYGAANGQEKSTEINENIYTAEFWQYDARIVRRWNVDPVMKEYESPYMAFGGNPVWFADLNGADTTLPGAAGSGSVNLPSSLLHVNILNWEEAKTPGVQWKLGRAVETYKEGWKYTISGTNTTVPVSAGELRSFTLTDLGTFNATWGTGADGNAVFAGYKNASGDDVNAAIAKYNAKLEVDNAINSINNFFSDPVNQAALIAAPLQMQSSMFRSGNLSARNPSVTFNQTVATEVRASAYTGVRLLSKSLIEQGIPRATRLQIINSFETGTITANTASNATFGIRFFDNINAFSKGRYLFPTFTNSTNRQGLALPYQWNQMTNFTQWQIRPGATYFSGRAAAQGNLGGGASQMFVPNLTNLIK